MTSTGTVHAKCLKLSGDTATGQILITAITEDGQVRDPVGNVVFSGPVTAKLINGLATLTLPATDSLTLVPTGFSYVAVEQLDHVLKSDYRTVEFQVPTDGTVELADLASNEELGTDPSYGASLNDLLASMAELEEMTGTGRLSQDDLAWTTLAAAMDVRGHSWPAGNGSSGVPFSWAGLVSAALGLPLLNKAVAGSSLSDHTGGTAGWVGQFLQAITRPAAYTVPSGLYVLMTGINDVAARADTALGMAGFKAALRAVVARMRGAAVFDYSDRTLTWPTGTWQVLESVLENSGSGYRYTTGNATFAITTPADFPGGIINVGFTSRLSGAGADIAVTVGVVTTTLDAHNAQTTGYIPMVLRVPNVPAGAQTLTFTVSNVVSLIGVNYWSWESPAGTGPRVVLVEQPKLDDYSPWGGVNVTDAGIDVLNGIFAAVATEFGSRVSVVEVSSLDNDDDMDAVAGHPNDAGHAKLAALVEAHIRDHGLTMFAPKAGADVSPVAAIGIVRSMVAGRYYGPPCPAGPGATAVGSGVATVVPLWVPPSGVTVSAISCEVTTAGAGDLRMGIYASNPLDQPASLVLDAGALVGALGTTGVKEITGLTQSLEPGLYWLCVAPQNTASGSYRTCGGSAQVPVAATSFIGTNGALGMNGYNMAIAGALPAAFVPAGAVAHAALAKIKAA